MPRKRGPKSSMAAKEAQEMDRAEAMALRRQNLPYREIAERMDCDPMTARRWVRHELQKAAEAAAIDRDVVLRTELDDLDALEQAALPVAMGLDGERDQWAAIDRVLAIKKRRAAYLGLDAAAKRASDPSGGGFTIVIGEGGVRREKNVTDTATVEVGK